MLAALAERPCRRAPKPRVSSSIVGRVEQGEMATSNADDDFATAQPAPVIFGGISAHLADGSQSDSRDILNPHAKTPLSVCSVRGGKTCRQPWQLSPEAVMTIPCVRSCSCAGRGGGRSNLGSVTWSSLPYLLIRSDPGLTVANGAQAMREDITGARGSCARPFAFVRRQVYSQPARDFEA
jgi:hypothetical protein